MFRLTPRNSEFFKKLIEFWKEIKEILDKEQIPYAIYGSFSQFYYVKSKNTSIHDIDVMIPKDYWNRLRAILEEKNITYEQNDEELFIQQDNLCVEVDDWGLGHEQLKKNITTKDVEAYDTIMRIVTEKTTEHIFILARNDPHNTDQEKIERKIQQFESFLGRKICLP